MSASRPDVSGQSPEESSAPGLGSPTGGEPAAAPPAAETAVKDPVPAAGQAWLGVFVSTATTVFLAELGDKTQLAALLLAAESGRPVVVFVGASLALICSSLVGVLLGRWLSSLMAPEQLERGAGVLMVVLGLWLGRQAVLQLAPTGLPLGGG